MWVGGIQKSEGKGEGEDNKKPFGNIETYGWMSGPEKISRWVMTGGVQGRKSTVKSPQITKNANKKRVCGSASGLENGGKGGGE